MIPRLLGSTGTSTLLVSKHARHTRYAHPSGLRLRVHKEAYGELAQPTLKKTKRMAIRSLVETGAS